MMRPLPISSRQPFAQMWLTTRRECALLYAVRSVSRLSRFIPIGGTHVPGSPWPVRTAVKGCGHAKRWSGTYKLKKAVVHFIRTNTKHSLVSWALLPSYKRKGLTVAISSTASSSSSTSSSSSSSSSSSTGLPAAAAAMAIGCPSTIHGSSRVANEGRRRAGGAPGAGGRCVRSSGTGSPFGGGAGRVLAWSGAMRPTRRLAGEATCGGYAEARCPKAQGAAPAVLGGVVMGAVLSALLGVVQAATASVPLPSQTLAPTLPLTTPPPPPVRAPGAALGAVLGGCSADHGSDRDANASFRHPRRKGMPAAAATAAAAKSTAAADAAAAAADDAADAAADDDDADAADDELASLGRLALFHSPAPWWALLHSPCTAGKPRLRCSASMRRTCACIRGGAPAKLACRCDGRCSKAAGVPSSTQAPAK